MGAGQSPGVGEPCLDIFPQSHSTHTQTHSEIVAHVHARPFIHTQTPTYTATHSDSTHSTTHMSTDSWTVNTLHAHCITFTHPQTHTATPSSHARSHTCRGNFSPDLPNTTTSPHSQQATPSQIQASILAGQGLGGRWPASRGPGQDSASAERVVPNPSPGSVMPASRPWVRSGAAAEAQPLPPISGPEPRPLEPRAWAAPGLQRGRAWGALQRARRARPGPHPSRLLTWPGRAPVGVTWCRRPGPGALRLRERVRAPRPGTAEPPAEGLRRLRSPERVLSGRGRGSRRRPSHGGWISRGPGRGGGGIPPARSAPAPAPAQGGRARNPRQGGGPRSPPPQRPREDRGRSRRAAAAVPEERRRL